MIERNQEQLLRQLLVASGSFGLQPRRSAIYFMSCRACRGHHSGWARPTFESFHKFLKWSVRHGPRRHAAKDYKTKRRFLSLLPRRRNASAPSPASQGDVGRVALQRTSTPASAPPPASQGEVGRGCSSNLPRRKLFLHPFGTRCFSSSPLRGEDRGEGPILRQDGYASVLRFEVAITQDWPLTPTLSPKGRGRKAPRNF
jgi:hypothetical protein